MSWLRIWKHGFRSEIHKDAMDAKSLARHAAPLRDMPLDRIETSDVLAVLMPIWKDRRVTASRLRGRIERILDAAKVKGLRFGENPARWRGHLDHLLNKATRLAPRHFAALPYSDVPQFVSDLRKRNGVAPLALEFLHP